MALNFPNSPVLNQEHIDSNSQKWIFNGDAWVRQAPEELGIEPPEDGLQYTRENKQWTPIDALANGDPLVAGIDYVRKDNEWAPQGIVGTGMKNLIINPENQVNFRTFDGKWGDLAEGKFGFDRWRKEGVNKVQYVEPWTLPYGPVTLSWKGVGNGSLGEAFGSADYDFNKPSAITIDSSVYRNEGKWLKVSVPQDATEIQLETGSLQTAFEVRLRSFEEILARNYFVAGLIDGWAPFLIREHSPILMQGNFIRLGVAMRTAPLISWKENVNGDPTWLIRSIDNTVDGTDLKVFQAANVQIYPHSRSQLIIQVHGENTAGAGGIWTAHINSAHTNILELDAEVVDKDGARPSS